MEWVRSERGAERLINEFLKFLCVITYVSINANNNHNHENYKQYYIHLKKIKESILKMQPYIK